MMPFTFRKHEKILLKNNSFLDEKWLQDRIAEDPEILGLGSLELIDKERFQPKAGRLDLLLRDPDVGKRYEVELMLGTLDESHIIRTIEYWDIERKRFPQYDHCAVIVAEKVNARFLNVISLFNSIIPIIAIQLNALRIDDSVVLNFTTVLDEIELGLESEEEGTILITNRQYWEAKNVNGGLKITDRFFEIIEKCDDSLELNYTKNYIGISRNGKAENFIRFFPKVKYVNIKINRTSDSSLWKAKLEKAGLEVLDMRDKRVVRFSVHSFDEFQQNESLFEEVIEDSYHTWFE